MVKKLHLPETLIFEWDKGNLEHTKKHKVEYNECEDIFFDVPVYFSDEKHSEKEDRFLAFGLTNENRLITLVFTIRNSKIRVVSARNQNRKEKETYNLNKQS